MCSSEQHPTSHRTPMIYIVKDDPDLAEMLSRQLIFAGYQTTIFHNTEDFRQACIGGGRPQAIVMGVVFPDGNDPRVRTINELKENWLDDIPVIFVSARTDIEARLSALRTGGARYFPKPLSVPRLIHALGDLTGKTIEAPYRVLLVDADELLLTRFSTQLQQAGMEVCAISQPLETLEQARAFRPDVILLDLHLPEITGLELAALLREEAGFADTPILILASAKGLPQQLAALKLDIDEFLEKTIAPEHLVAAVKVRCKRSRNLQTMTDHLRQTLHERDYQQFALDQHAIVSIADASGTITYVNDKFCEISGYTASELTGQNHRIVKSGVHLHDYYEALWVTISSGRVWRGEICNRAKDGSLYWVESTIVPFLDANGLPYQYVSIRTDITPLMDVEQHLRAERDFSNAVINALPGTFYVISETGQLLQTNDNFARISGYAPEEILQMTPFDFFPESEQAVISDKIQACFTQGEAQVQSLLLTKSGGQIPFLFQAISVELGKQRCLIGTGTDISDLKHAEQAHIAAKKEAERANLAKSQFLSSMSHELRTPMNAVLGFAQLMEMDARLSDDNKESVREILKAGHHLLKLINEVLNLAKIESGNIALSIEPVALAEVVSECLTLTHSLANTHDIQVETADLTGVVLRADYMRLKQVLLNLLSNAVKYNQPQGKVQLYCSNEDEHIVRIVVSDTGQGIPQARLAELFQPFNRLGAESGSIQGSGIGLTISRQLVELMGGNIGVETTSGSGTQFWIELPRERRQAIRPTVDGRPAKTMQHNVLYIDDNLSNLKHVSKLLGQRPRLRLMTAHTPQMGLDLAAANSFDLILLDINMPDMDGFEVLTKLQERGLTRNTTVIAMTANNTPRDIKRGLDAGFTDYLTKPIDVARFFSVLDNHLEDPAKLQR